MRGINLNDIPVKSLQQTVFTLSRRRESKSWPKDKCIQWLTKNHIDELNIGDLCRALLRVVVRKNSDGFAVGLNYTKITEIVKSHFPYSAVDVRHLSWYAHTMRGRNELIPVYREAHSPEGI